MSRKVGGKQLGRRDFLRLAAGAGAAALASCAPGTPQVVKETVAPEKVVQTVVVKETVAPVKVVETVVVKDVKKEAVFGLNDGRFNKHHAIYQHADDFAAAFPDKAKIRFAHAQFDMTKIGLEVKAKRSSLDAFIHTEGRGNAILATRVDAIVPLDDILPQAIKNDIAPAGLDEGTGADGKLWMWPFTVDTSGIEYRPSMLEQAGYKDGPPDTWDEFLECLAAIQKTVKAKDGSPVYPLTWDPHRTERAYTSSGMSLLGVDGFFSADPKQYINWDHPGMIDHLTFLKKLVPYSAPETFSPADTYLEVFAASKAAMIWSTIGRGPEVAQGTFGLQDVSPRVAPKPNKPVQGDGSIRSLTWSTGAYFFKYGPQWRDCFDFLVWCWPQDNFQRLQTIQGKWNPSSLTAAKATWLPMWMKVNYGIVAQGKPFPRGNELYIGLFDTVWGPIFRDYLQGKIATPKEALQKGKTEFAKAVQLSGIT